MKYFMLLIAVLLVGTGALVAQDHYLPVSSKSTEAKTAYYAGLAAGENFEIEKVFSQMEKAYALDDRFFFALALPYFYHATFGNEEAARQMLVKALAVKPNKFNKAEQIIRNMLLARQADPAAKLSKYNQELVAAYPDIAQAYEYAAHLSLAFDGDPDESIRYSKQLVALRPDYGSAHNGLGYAYMAKGDMAQAKAHFAQYIAVSPDNPNAYDSMAEYYLNRKDYAKSAELYERAAEMGMQVSADRAKAAKQKLKESAPAERYTQQGKEVEMVKASVQAYSKGDWATFRSSYSADAEIYHNSSVAVDPESFVEGSKATVAALASYELESATAEYERVVTDEGDTWVNYWGDWKGTLAGGGEEVVIPVHFTVRIVNGKVVEEHAYYSIQPLDDALAAAAPAPIHYVEMWNAKPAWEALSEAKRNEFMAAVGSAIEQLMAQGVEIVSFGMNDKATDKRMGYDIFAIWSFPDAAAARNFEKQVAGSGWYDYFEQYNISGTVISPEMAMQKMIKMKGAR